MATTYQCNFWSDDNGFGFCACGSPEKVVGWVLDYLSTADGYGICKTDDDLSLLVAYLCDMRGLTDHGTSVFAAWLTDKGRAVLDAAARLAARGDDPADANWAIFVESDCDDWPEWTEVLPLVGVQAATD